MKDDAKNMNGHETLEVDGCVFLFVCGILFWNWRRSKESSCGGSCTDSNALELEDLLRFQLLQTVLTRTYLKTCSVSRDSRMLQGFASGQNAQKNPEKHRALSPPFHMQFVSISLDNLLLSPETAPSPAAYGFLPQTSTSFHLRSVSLQSSRYSLLDPETLVRNLKERTNTRWS